jgi:hypothetical protein
MGTWGGLSRFDLLWDVLHPQEKTRIVHVMVERVVCSGDQGYVQIVFRESHP